MIRVENLKKTFGNLQAVADVSFQAPSGRITGILGPNGAGKSTTLRMITGILRPDSGSVFIDDIDMIKQPIAAKEKMGVLADAKGLYPRLTAKENIQYYGKLRGMKTAHLRTRIETLVKLLEMDDILNKPTHGFSTGQKVKVALARALVHDPENVLLDEPTSGLDLMAARSVRVFIQQMKAEGRTILFTSHIMEEVSLLCDEIILIRQGRVAIAGNEEFLLRESGFSNLEDAFVSLLSHQGALS